MGRREIARRSQSSDSKMYAVVIAPNVPSTLLAKCLPQEINLFEDTARIEGEALVRDNQRLVGAFQSNGVNVIQLDESMQDALITYMCGKDEQYITLFEERGFREQGPRFQKTIATTPRSLELLIEDMQDWSKQVLNTFNDDRGLSRNGMELAKKEWRFIEERVLEDRDRIQERTGCLRQDAMRYALAWNNLLFRGERSYTVGEIMQAYGHGKKDHVAGKTVVTREGVILTEYATRNSAEFSLPIGSNMFFATDTFEVFSIEGDNDYRVVLGNMEKLIRRAEPSLVRAGLINLGLDSRKIRQPSSVWEGGNLIKFFGNCQSSYNHKAIYVGITERTGYLAAQEIANILNDFLEKHKIQMYVVDLPQGGDSHNAAQENMHLDFKANWFLEENGKYSVVLNETALKKSAGKELKFYRVIPLNYRGDRNDLEGDSTYLPAGNSEEVLAHFKRLKKEGVVGGLYLLPPNESAFGANFVDGVTNGKVFIAPPNYRQLNKFVRKHAKEPVLFELVNNAAFGSVRCSTTSFYAGDFLQQMLGKEHAAKYVKKAN